MLLEMKIALLQAQGRWFLDRALAVHLHAKLMQNESLMNIRLGFIQASQSRTVLFALFSSDETDCFRKKSCSRRRKARAVTWNALKIQGGELKDSHCSVSGVSWWFSHANSHVSCTLLWKIPNAHAFTTRRQHFKSKRHVIVLNLANSAALLQHISTTDSRCEQSYQLISGCRCLLMLCPAGLRQVGTHQNSAGVFACLCLFHTFIVYCGGGFFPP